MAQPALQPTRLERRLDSAWVTCDGQVLPIYGVKQVDRKTQSCWIPSVVGKQFEVHVRTDDQEVDISAAVYTDGACARTKAIGGEHGAAELIVDSKAITILLQRPLLFKEIRTTDDSSVTGPPPAVGIITVKFTPEPRGQTTATWKPTGSAVPLAADGITVYEKTLKMGGHQVVLGEVEFNKSKFHAPKRGCVGFDPRSIFEFHYRPLAALQAKGIAPFVREATIRIEDDEVPSPTAQGLELAGVDNVLRLQANARVTRLSPLDFAADTMVRAVQSRKRSRAGSDSPMHAPAVPRKRIRPEPDSRRSPSTEVGIRESQRIDQLHRTNAQAHDQRRRSYTAPRLVTPPRQPPRLGSEQLGAPREITSEPELPRLDSAQLDHPRMVSAQRESLPREGTADPPLMPGADLPRLGSRQCQSLPREVGVKRERFDTPLPRLGSEIRSRQASVKSEDLEERKPRPGNVKREDTEGLKSQLLQLQAQIQDLQKHINSNEDNVDASLRVSIKREPSPINAWLFFGPRETVDLTRDLDDDEGIDVGRSIKKEPQEINAYRFYRPGEVVDLTMED